MNCRVKFFGENVLTGFNSCIAFVQFGVRSACLLNMECMFLEGCKCRSVVAGRMFSEIVFVMHRNSVNHN